MDDIFPMDEGHCLDDLSGNSTFSTVASQVVLQTGLEVTVMFISQVKKKPSL